MSLLTAHFLTPKQIDEVQKLVQTSQEEVSYPLFSDLEDASVDYGFPRFFLRYENDSELTGAVFFSILCDEEWQCFFFGSQIDRLLACALDTATEFVPEQTSVYAPIAPENVSARTILATASGTFAYSHYRMVCICPSKKIAALPDNCFLQIKTVKNEDENPVFRCSLRLSGRGVGRAETISSCTVTRMGRTAFLSGVKTKKRNQNQGFGFLLLSNVLCDDRFSDVNSFALHVESFRKPAVHLYQKLGFSVTEQIDVWELL